ncbi:hypothetical protein O181_052497 [Austropuccinia psidii MF-1]|uniref:Integrase catalytic domain-containing protein n=1 Tax=Austropuccinia psidii MF-1 TaxID=1389203 RepID=A0A9Q3E318_9BASI|nr:hypothetical protein [Austropuccinia psidii MF-1]
MDWVIVLPPGGDTSYNSCLVIVDRLNKSPNVLPCHKDGIAMDTALLIWNRLVSWTGILTNNISDIDPKFTSEGIVRIFSAYGLKLRDCYGFTHDWCTLLPKLKLVYKTPIDSSINQNPDILEKGLNPRLPQDSFRKDLVEIHPIAAIFKGILYKARDNSVRCMEDSFSYSKDKWNKSHVSACD